MNRRKGRRIGLRVPIDDISESDIQKDLQDLRYYNPGDRLAGPVYVPEIDPNDNLVELGGGRNREGYRLDLNAFPGGGRAVNKFRDKEFDPSLEAQNFRDSRDGDDLLADAMRDAGVLNPGPNLNDIRGREYERRFEPRQDDQGSNPSLSDTVLSRPEKLRSYPSLEPLETDKDLFDRPKLDNGPPPSKGDPNDWGSVPTKWKQQLRDRKHRFFQEHPQKTNNRHEGKDKESLQNIIAYLKKQTEAENGKPKSHANVRHSSTPEIEHDNRNKTIPLKKINKKISSSVNSTSSTKTVHSITSERSRQKGKKFHSIKKLVTMKTVLTTGARPSTEENVLGDTVYVDDLSAEDLGLRTMAEIAGDETTRQPTHSTRKDVDTKTKTSLVNRSHVNKTVYEIVDRGSDSLDLNMTSEESSWKNLLHGRRDIVLSGSVIAGVGILLILFSIFQMLLSRRKKKTPTNENNNKMYRRLGSSDERMGLREPQHSLFPLSSDEESDEETVYHYMKYRDGHH